MRNPAEFRTPTVESDISLSGLISFGPAFLGLITRNEIAINMFGCLSRRPVIVAYKSNGSGPSPYQKTHTPVNVKGYPCEYNSAALYPLPSSLVPAISSHPAAS